MKKVLVTGGTGYIGSHTVVELIEAGFEVIVVDNLMNSSVKSLEGVEKITGIRPKFYKVDLTNIIELEKLFIENPDISAILHFAALKAVGESAEKPLLYYKNNINSLLNLLEIIQKKSLSINFIFSSSCTVYGVPKYLPLDEFHPFGQHLSTYGYTKQISENILQDFTKIKDSFNVISLRYFNPIGAHSSGFIGESPIVPYNLIPILAQTASGKREKMYVYGNDYDTTDGTCIRDYIHVVDLAKAHICALKYMIEQRNINQYDYFNLGVGKGFSVLEVIETFEKVSNKKINYQITERRLGDIPAAYANPQKANTILNWDAKLTLEEMLYSAWLWESKNRYY